MDLKSMKVVSKQLSLCLVLKHLLVWRLLRGRPAEALQEFSSHWVAAALPAFLQLLPSFRDVRGNRNAVAQCSCAYLL